MEAPLLEKEDIEDDEIEDEADDEEELDSCDEPVDDDTEDFDDEEAPLVGVLHPAKLNAATIVKIIANVLFMFTPYTLFIVQY